MAKLSQKSHDELVVQIYRSPFRREQWQPFVDLLSASLGGGIWVAMHGHDRVNNRHTGGNTHWDPHFIATYAGEYAALNPWNDAVERMPIGVAWESEAMFAQAELLRSRFYNEWIRPQEDIGSGAGVTVFKSPDSFVRLSCNIRLRDQEALQSELVATLNLLAPHLCEAARLERMLWQAQYDSSLILLENLRIAGFLIGENGLIHRHNQSATTLIDRHLRLVHGQLRTWHANDQSRLDAVVLAALQTEVPINPEAMFAVVGAADGTPLMVRALNINYVSEQLFARRCAVILVSSIHTLSEKLSEVLARFHGLTASESQLALAIAYGKSPESYAGANGLKIGTVRQRLKQVLAKTGTHRQSVLVALVKDYQASLTSLGIW